jgi:hypothetical protein
MPAIEWEMDFSIRREQPACAAGMATSNARQSDWIQPLHPAYEPRQRANLLNGKFWQLIFREGAAKCPEQHVVVLA